MIFAARRLTSLHSGIVARLQFCLLLSYLSYASEAKTKVKKCKGAATAPKKQSDRAAKRAQAPAALQQDLGATEEGLTSDEALTDPLQGMANCLDNMMTMLLELSLKVHGMDKAAAEQTRIPLTSPPRPQLGTKGPCIRIPLLMTWD